MSRLLLTAAVLAVLVYTMVLGVRWLSPRIEQDIAGRVTTGLAEQGLLWADVTVEGRDVVLSGQAPDAEAKARALNVATRVFGVSKVQDNLTVVGDVSATDVTAAVSATAPVKAEKQVAAKAKKSAEDYALSITKVGDKIILEGAVPDQASKDVVVRLASTHYGVENIESSGLVIEEGAPAGWRSAVGAVLMHISNMEDAKVVISNTEVMVSGSVQDKEYADKMEADVTQVLPKDFKAAFAVEVVTPTVASDVEPAAGADTSGTAAVTACASDVDLSKQTLKFGFDKAELTAEHQPKIDAVVKQMKTCADEKVVLAGYTDVTGSKLYNKWLSQQRAEATLRGLTRNGVAKDRLQAVGYGEQFPVAANTSRAGRAENRRVEFHAGAELPHPVSVTEVAPDVKKAAPKKVVAKKVKVEEVSTTEPKVETAPVVVSETTDASASIAKPWWARKTVSETAVEVK